MPGDLSMASLEPSSQSALQEADTSEGSDLDKAWRAFEEVMDSVPSIKAAAMRTGSVNMTPAEAQDLELLEVMRLHYEELRSTPTAVLVAAAKSKTTSGSGPIREAVVPWSGQVLGAVVFSVLMGAAICKLNTWIGGGPETLKCFDLIMNVILVACIVGVGRTMSALAKEVEDLFNHQLAD